MISSFAHLVTAPNLQVLAPRVYFSGVQDLAFPRLYTTPRTPNGQPITRFWSTGRYLLVYTRSRIYYLRRNKLRLWRRL